MNIELTTADQAIGPTRAEFKGAGCPAGRYAKPLRWDTPSNIKDLERPIQEDDVQIASHADGVNAPTRRD